MRPILVSRLQRLLDQETPEAGAVDEQVGVHDLAVVEPDTVDKPVVRAERDVDHLAFAPHDAARLGEFSQIGGIETGVEMEGVAHVRQRRVSGLDRPHEAPLAGGRRLQGEVR